MPQEGVLPAILHIAPQEEDGFQFLCQVCIAAGPLQDTRHGFCGRARQIGLIQGIDLFPGLGVEPGGWLGLQRIQQEYGTGELPLTLRQNPNQYTIITK